MRCLRSFCICVLRPHVIQPSHIHRRESRHHQLMRSYTWELYVILSLYNFTRFDLDVIVDEGGGKGIGYGLPFFFRISLEVDLKWSDLQHVGL